MRGCGGEAGRVEYRSAAHHDDVGMTAQRRGIDRVDDPFGMPPILFDLFPARHYEHRRGQRQRVAMCLEIRRN